MHSGVNGRMATSSMATAEPRAEPDENDFTDIVILSKGRALQYTVPSFPVCKAVLWEVKLQWKDHAEDVTHVFDGFFLENVKS